MQNIVSLVNSKCYLVKISMQNIVSLVNSKCNLVKISMQNIVSLVFSVLLVSATGGTTAICIILSNCYHDGVH
jgi:uncharacterized protein YlzI (FlbEa/FlbD family)